MDPWFYLIQRHLQPTQREGGEREREREGGREGEGEREREGGREGEREREREGEREGG